MSFPLESFIFFTLLSSSFLYSIANAVSPDLQSYIIQVQQPSTNTITDYESWHRSFLPQSSSSPDRLIHSYTEVFSGFSAKLTNQEVKDMESKPGFIRSFPSKLIPLHTTHTPDFLDLSGPSGLWNTSSNLGQGIIIGLLDSGILPNHPSYSDKNMPPPPKKWKGICGFQDKSSCNNKLIGARSFIQNQDPSDSVGHGSHTSSTAAGNFVEDVDFFGLGSSTMSGMAPQAHLAMYKVCSSIDGCPLEDVLAGLDAAVKDGVDVLSLSLEGGFGSFDSNPLSIATFKAVSKGVAVVCSGGNSGPTTSTVSNDAPWILTVAASSIDRNFRSIVKLGNEKEYYGEALYQPSNYTSVPFPLIFDINSTCNVDNNKGKITVCLDHPFGKSLGSTGRNSSASSEGVIKINWPEQEYTIRVAPRSLPSSQVSWNDGLEIIAYIGSTNSTTPTGTIMFNHTVLGVSPSRVIAFYSSRGPSIHASYILKPDISAPGLNIIAAWNNIIEGSGTKFPINVQSGTSMAAPHVSGVAALLKSMHPNWSP